MAQEFADLPMWKEVRIMKEMKLFMQERNINLEILWNWAKANYPKELQKQYTEAQLNALKKSELIELFLRG